MAERGLGVREVECVLDRHRHPEQGCTVTVPIAFGGIGGLGAGKLGQQGHVRVHLRVQPLDALDQVLGDVDRVEIAACEGVGEFTDRQVAGGINHGDAPLR
ncbi:hypothetical protein P3H15_46085 [Rhodococcus sp. T2V]|nr:hypothetical protein [Rhodococcus sp. T2V]MDF3312329.1 hypothetical protein [Rhodococcus sp. T2V]